MLLLLLPLLGLPLQTAAGNVAAPTVLYCTVLVRGESHVLSPARDLSNQNSLRLYL
jgi:hypothetical protein